MASFLRFFAFGTLGISALLWGLNSSHLVDELEQHETRIIAHRGMHHIYRGTDRSITSCQAAPVEAIEHSFIENTIPSMKEAFRLGADIVELDVHLTAENIFAVFHDWTLDCRTNGTGVTHKQDFATLAALDVGYNIDDGSGSFALRGKGVGLMPSLNAVLAEEMGGQFLVNFKSRRAQDGVALASLLEDAAQRKQVFGVYGGAAPSQSASARVPDLRGFDKRTVQSCLIQYAALGWSGFVPKVCRNTLIMVPQNYAKFLWGWPHRMTRRFGAMGTDVILVGPYDGTGFSSGIDTTEAFARVPVKFDGFVWTNRIELIGPMNEARK